MKKQMKTFLILMVVLASSVSVVYAVKQVKPDLLSELVQDIFDSVMGVKSDLATHNTTILTAIDTHENQRATANSNHETAVLGAITAHEGAITSAITAHDEAIDLRLGWVESRISAIPVMTSASGRLSNSTAASSSGTYVVYNSPIYQFGAVFNVVVSGVVLPDGGVIWVSTRIPYTDGDGNPWQSTVRLSDMILSTADGPLVLEFTGIGCMIQVYVPEGATFGVTCYVTTTTTHVPTPPPVP